MNLIFKIFAKNYSYFILLFQNHYKQLFEEFIKTHNKFYESQIEYEHRFHVFIGNMKKAEALQSREQGTAQYGVTKFSDLTGKLNFLNTIINYFNIEL